MVNIGDMVSGVQRRINDIPSDITGSPMIYEWANDARIDIQNYCGASINASSITEKFQPAIKNLASAYVLSYMTGVGVDFSYGLGELRVNKGGGSDKNAKQLEFFVAQANRSMKMIGRKANWKLSNL